MSTRPTKKKGLDDPNDLLNDVDVIRVGKPEVSEVSSATVSSLAEDKDVDETFHCTKCQNFGYCPEHMGRSARQESTFTQHKVVSTFDSNITEVNKELQLLNGRENLSERYSSEEMNAFFKNLRESINNT